MLGPILPQHDQHPDWSQIGQERVAAEIGPAPENAFVVFWGSVVAAVCVAGVVVGAVIAGPAGAFGGGGVALVGCGMAVVIHTYVGGLLGDAVSRSAATAAGASGGILAMQTIRPFKEWEIVTATVAGAAAAAIAACVYREHLAWEYGSLRWKFTTRALLARVVHLSVPAALWTLCCP